MTAANSQEEGYAYTADYYLDESIVTLTAPGKLLQNGKGILTWAPNNLIEKSRKQNDVRVSVQVDRPMTVEIYGLSAAECPKGSNPRSWMEVQLLIDGTVVDRRRKNGRFHLWEESVSVVRALEPSQLYDIWVHQLNYLASIYASYVRVRIR